MFVLLVAFDILRDIGSFFESFLKLDQSLRQDRLVTTY